MTAVPAVRRARKLERQRRRALARRPAALAGDAGFVAVIAALGVVAGWPIYQDWWFVLVAAVGVVLAVAISVVSLLRRWRWWWTAAACAGAYLVCGIPLAAPSALGDPGRLLPALREVVIAPVTGWKNLLTLDLPLGTYQATLAPALLVFLVAPAVSLAFAWRIRKMWMPAVPAALLMPVFGILFGSSTVRGMLRLGPVTVPGTVEALVGIGSVLAGLGWYVWRIASERGQAVRLAQSTSGVRVSRSTGAAWSRWAIAGAMVVIAVLAGVFVAPLALAHSTRDVLRTGVDPELHLRQALSPLTDYRANFADDRFDTPLFEVRSDGAADRVRLATLSFYDGVVARVMDPTGTAGDQATAFVRVPAAGRGATETTTVTIDGYTGIWVPTVGQLSGISFEGAARSALSDGFFYNSSSSTGVELDGGGLASGVAYSQTGTPAPASDLGTLAPGAAVGLLDDDLVPASVDAWIEAQDAPSGSAGLALLIDRLRARGYLSHSLLYDQEHPPAWASDLADYSFRPSRAGHSLDRIDALFTQLLDRQNDVGGTDDRQLVAAAGDDEQFAVAAALIADRLGFASRIVLGARLSSDDDTLPTCQGGVCRGGDMAAWIEVQNTSGQWVPIDTSPQHEIVIAPEIQQRSDPQIPTKVEPEQAKLVPPPDAAPAEGGANQNDDPSSGPDLGALWAGLRIAGFTALALVIVLGPFFAILLAKLLRRRSRRTSTVPVDRMVGGWDEYVDAAVDHGEPLPGTQTRRELAELYDAGQAGHAVILATWADRSTFSYENPEQSESDAFWELVEAERARMLSELGWWRRLRMRLSLRSLRRSARELASEVRARGADRR